MSNLYHEIRDDENSLFDTRVPDNADPILLKRIKSSRNQRVFLVLLTLWICVAFVSAIVCGVVYTLGNAWTCTSNIIVAVFVGLLVISSLVFSIHYDRTTTIDYRDTVRQCNIHQGWDSCIKNVFDIKN